MSSVPAVSPQNGPGRRRLGINEKDARRLLDPRHASEVATLKRALLAVGRRLAIEVEKAA